MIRRPYSIKINLQRYTLVKEFDDLIFVTGDNQTCEFVFEVMEDDYKVFDYTNIAPKLVIKTPGNIVQALDCEVIGDRCRVMLPLSMIEDVGEHICELQLYDSETQAIRVTSPIFIYPVRASLERGVM